jgi:hypothetical protein
VRSGFNPFPLPHESSCIAAIALSLKATVTDQFGQPFVPYNIQAQMHWEFQ